jgi:cystathionine gamma-synthase
MVLVALSNRPQRSGTLAVHGGEPRRKAAAAVTTPISLTATYAFDNSQEIADHFEGKIERGEYGRYGNPTVAAAEQKLAALDGAEDSVLMSSGMAAITTTLFAVLRQGQHVLMTSDCYRRTRQFVTTVLSRFGVESTLVEPGDYDAIEAAIRPDSTRMLLMESPTNPYLRCVDLERMGAIRERHPKVLTLIDSTFATPLNQRPLDAGIDLVFHSATKYLGGHNDLLAGAVSGRAALVGAIREFRGVMGGVLDAHSAYLLIRGLKTLDLRVRRQNESTLQVARWLERHPTIERVYYPGLESHPDHAVAKRQMAGFGGVVSFLVRGGLQDASRFIDGIQLATIAPSLGSVETLIEQPALMSFYELTTEQRLAVGIRDNLIRMAVGIEDVDDIIADLSHALERT